MREGQTTSMEGADVAPAPDKPTAEAGSLRHRPAPEIRFGENAPEPMRFEPSLLLPGDLAPRAPRTGSLNDGIRAGLWEVVDITLFAKANEREDLLRRVVSLRGASVGERTWKRDEGAPSALVKHVWSSPPLRADIERVPADVAELIAGWFSLVEAGDVYAVLESVHDSIDAALRLLFTTALNTVLDRGQSDHRFVMRKMLPISARTDIAAIERALATCKANHWADSDKHLLESLMRLAVKPLPDVDGAIHEALRTVEATVLAVTGDNRPLEEALEVLEKRGLIAKTLKSAYAGLFTYVTNGARKATTEDARLIVVMCASFVNHLAAQVGHVVDRTPSGRMFAASVAVDVEITDADGVVPTPRP
jgi:hypothetical protein